MEIIVWTIEQIRNWNWYSILSVALPSILSFIAILKTLEIANKQNKIALFEKRLNVYDEITTLKVFYDNLEFHISKKYNINSISAIKIEVIENLLNSTLQINTKETGSFSVNIYLSRLDRSLTSSYFLFDFIDKDDIEKLFRSAKSKPSKMYELFDALFSHKENDIKKLLKEAQSELKIFTDKYLEKIEKELNL